MLSWLRYQHCFRCKFPAAAGADSDAVERRFVTTRFFELQPRRIEEYESPWLSS